MEKLKAIWKKWIEMGEWIGDKVSIVVLSLIYITLVIPLSLFYKAGKEKRGWIKAGGEIDEGSQF